MAVLATPDDYAALTGVTDGDKASISLALSAASAATERYCGRSFAEARTTEYYDGTGYPELPLNRFPVSDAVGDAPVVYLDLNGSYGQAANAYPSSTLLVQGTNYVVVYDRGVLQTKTVPGWWPPAGGPGYSPWGYPGLARRGAAYIAWPKVPGCLKVTYTAGYAIIPADLVAAVVSMAQYILVATPGGGMVTTSQSYIDTSVGSGFLAEMLARGSVPALASARAVLDSYKEFVVNRGIF